MFCRPEKIKVQTKEKQLSVWRDKLENREKDMRAESKQSRVRMNGDLRLDSSCFPSVVHLPLFFIRQCTPTNLTKLSAILCHVILFYFKDTEKAMSSLNIKTKKNVVLHKLTRNGGINHTRKNEPTYYVI